MDKIKKLLKQLNKTERINILKKISSLEKRSINGLDIKKIKNSNYFRLRIGRIRVIFHYEEGDFFLDSIRKRDDKTYNKIRGKK